MKKYLDLLDADDIKEGDKHRVKACPYPKDCMPTSLYIGKNKAGCCAGLIHICDNLDCIRICVFYRTKEGKLRHLENFMTPEEAVWQANCLLSATSSALGFASSYQKHHDHLCDIREKGDRSPSKIK